MGQIDIVVPRNATRQWHGQIVARLRAMGHDIILLEGPVEPQNPFLSTVLALERKLFKLAEKPLSDRLALPFGNARQNALRLNLGNDPGGSSYWLAFDCGNRMQDLAAALAQGTLPTLELRSGTQCIGRAHPMIDNRVSFARGLDDVLARAVSLTVVTMHAVASGRLLPAKGPLPSSRSSSFALGYLSSALPRLGREILRRRTFRSAHWRVGYRLIDGDGVAETASLAGAPWTVLPDDGTHFYADPFPVFHDGRYYIFVEDLAHATNKGVISVSELDDAGVAGKPYRVLEQPYHLSYPQIIKRDNGIWMLPEASAGHELVLYRALDFPRRWERHAVLIAGREISDATLLEHDGAFWLFATDRDGAGSTSDLQVVFRADDLEGPWVEHALNPTIIDRNGARPGGAFIRSGEHTLLPIQDGTLGYGGGLGLSELLALDGARVDLAPPRPIDAGTHWPYPKIHTLNRAGRLEVIDGIADVRK